MYAGDVYSCRRSKRTVRNRVEGILKENGHDTEFSDVIYVGGGATIMKNYGRQSNNISYIEDVRANAIGYISMRPIRQKGQRRSFGKILQGKISWILRQAERQGNVSKGVSLLLHFLKVLFSTGQVMW